MQSHRLVLVMKDTKGIRQVLEELLEPNADDETPEGSIRNYRTLVLHDSEMDKRIDKAVPALQEIMLGMLPEKFEPVMDSEGDKYLTDTKDGWNRAVDLMEQNIRGGFNNG